jgi:hypothetical protein
LSGVGLGWGVVVIEREESRGWFLEGGGNIFQVEKGMKSLNGRCVRQHTVVILCLLMKRKKQISLAKFHIYIV